MVKIEKTLDWALVVVVAHSTILLILSDYLLSHSSTIKTKKGPLIPLETLWPVVLEMGEFWAAQDNKGGSHGLGDVWPCSVLDVHQSATVNSTDHFVPFHKLTQWLVYSLIEPLERLLGATIEGKDMLTPLPDYCHGKQQTPFSVFQTPPHELTSFPFFFYLSLRRFVNGHRIDFPKTK